MEYELLVIGSQNGFRRLKGNGIFPVDFVYPLYCGFVIAVEWVFNEFMCHQVGVYRTGYTGGQPFAYVSLSELPAGIKLLVHRIVGIKSGKAKQHCQNENAEKNSVHDVSILRVVVHLCI